MRRITRRASLTLVTALAVTAIQVGSPMPACAKDLTQLSLEELMHLDVIQVSVPGAHFHYQGDWMIGYEYDSSRYGGYLSGSSAVSNQQVLSRFMMAETRMQTDMQGLMLMYGKSDAWTYDLMIPYMNMTMDQVFTNGITTSNHTTGIGDVYVGAIHSFKYHYPIQWLGEIAFGLPTGNNDQFGLMTGMFGPQKLPYDMQLGSGSFTFQPTLTYLGETAKLSWGAQARGYVPINENWNGYYMPDRASVTGWIAPQVNKHFSPSLRLDYVTQGNVRGEDPGIDFTMMPGSDPNLYAGSRADVYIGVNWNPHNDGEGHGGWFTAEYGWPFYQSLTGPQLKLNGIFSIAGQWTFK